MLSSKCLESKGFVFTLEVVIALIILMGFLGIASIEQVTKEDYLQNLEINQAMNDTVASLDENGFIVGILDAQGTTADEKMDAIYAKITGLLPQNLQTRIELSEFDANAEICRGASVFAECFSRTGNFPSRGPALPLDKSVSSERLIVVKKQPPMMCEVIATFSEPEAGGITKGLEIGKTQLMLSFAPYTGPLYFQGENDLNIIFGVRTDPEGTASCDEDIRVDINAYGGGRNQADIMLVMDRSGSMCWDDRYSASGTERDVFIDDNGFAEVVYLGTSSYVYKMDVNSETGYMDYTGFRRGIDDALGIHVDGDYVFVADESSGLRILEKETLASVRTIDGMTRAEAVFAEGDYVYVATSGSPVNYGYGASMTSYSDDYERIGYSPTYSWTAQSFEAELSGIDGVRLYLRRYSNPNDLTVHLRSTIDGADLTNGTVTVPAGDIRSGGYRWEYIDFPAQVSVTLGQTYYIVLTTTSQSTSRYYRWGSRSRSSDPYSNGSIYRCRSNGSCTARQPPNQSQYEDARFQTYYYEEPDEAGIVVVNKSDADPANWFIEGSLYDTGSGLIDDSSGIFVEGDYAYISDGTDGDSYDGLWIIDVSAPASPSKTGFVNTSSARAVEVSGNYAYVADGGGGLKIVDIQNKSTPSIADTVSGLGTVYDVSIYDTNAYVIADTGSGSTGYGTEVIDISSPLSAVKLSTFYSAYSFYKFDVGRGFAFIAGNQGLTSVNKVLGPKMPKAREAAKQFVLFDEWTEENDQIGIVSFSSYDTLEHNLVSATSANKTSINNEIDTIRGSGSTAMGDGIDRAQDELLGVRGQEGATKFEVLLTDGVNNAGMDPITAANNAAAAGIKIYTIGFGGDADTSTLQQIANITDANYYAATDENALQEVYNLIARDIGAELEGQGALNAEDVNIMIPIGNCNYIVDTGEGTCEEINDANYLWYDVGDFTDQDKNWAGYFVINIPCNTGDACESSTRTFPEEGTYFYWSNEEGTVQGPILWDQNITIIFNYRDLSVDVIDARIIGANQVYLDVNARNIGLLSSGATVLDFYLDDPETGSLLASENVPALSPGEGEVFLDEELSNEGWIYVIINREGAISECPGNNIVEVYCAGGIGTAYFALDIWSWRD